MCVGGGAGAARSIVTRMGGKCRGKDTSWCMGEGGGGGGKLA